MPELPEVEYTARQLRAAVVGATIREALVFWERTVRYPDVATFLDQVRGQRIEGIRRRGKFLLFDLSGGLFLSVHRRMSGNCLLLLPGWRLDMSLHEQDSEAWNTKGPTFFTEESEDTRNSVQQEIRYCRVCFVLEDGRCLLFTDPRKFGRIELWPLSQERKAFAGLGPEPLEESFTSEYLQSELNRRRVSIKQLLLDQTVVAGVGNIYADEALFYARVHPKRLPEALTLEEIRLLHEGIVKVLLQGIEHGGTSFNDYHDLWGEAGENYSHVQVYNREGQPCPRCGTQIERTVIAQRSAHYCPTCQENVGITSA